MGYPHYALYQPLTDCFLLVLDDLEHAKMIKTLAMTRYSLFIFQIDRATNYTANLIDNDCCENWAPMLGQFTDFAKIGDMRPVLVSTLESREHAMPDMIREEKHWLRFMLHWLNFVDSLTELIPWFEQQQTMSDVLGLDFQHFEQDRAMIQSARTVILKNLLLGRDISKVNQTIMSELQKWPRVRQKLDDYQS